MIQIYISHSHTDCTVLVTAIGNRQKTHKLSSQINVIVSAAAENYLVSGSLVFSNIIISISYLSTRVNRTSEECSRNMFQLNGVLSVCPALDTTTKIHRNKKITSALSH